MISFKNKEIIIDNRTNNINTTTWKYRIDILHDFTLVSVFGFTTLFDTKTLVIGKKVTIQK